MFIKEQVSEANIDELITKLSPFGISISKYQAAMQLPEIFVTTS